LKSETTCLTTADSDGIKQRYIGTFKLHLTDDANVTHTYEVPNCIYDPSTNFNIIGVPFLQKFFDDFAAPNDDFFEEGTIIMSAGRRSRLVWDHGQHVRHFTHGNSDLPELELYQGTSYFQSFCTRLGNFYQDNINFAFSSAYSICPDPAVVSDTESDSEDDTEDEWYTPTPPPTSIPSASASETVLTHPPQIFELGASLSYFDGQGKAMTVVYEGASPDGKMHT
ncbi:hypothetical protein ACHAXR_000296, partial [Thalassiosira sp. AJA248-18]